MPTFYFLYTYLVMKVTYVVTSFLTLKSFTKIYLLLRKSERYNKARDGLLGFMLDETANKTEYEARPDKRGLIRTPNHANFNC